MSRGERPALRRLAHEHGILPGYEEIGGTRRITSDATRIALLAAMGVDASTERGASAALERLERNRHERLSPPVMVLSGRGSEIPVSLPATLRGRMDWRADLITDDGDRRAMEGTSFVRPGQRTLRLSLPDDLPPGYHSVRIRVRAAGIEREAESFVILAPALCTHVHDLIGEDRVFGLNLNLYTLRTRENWGVGDFTDLSAVADWIGREGAEFIGLNPLHALRNDGFHVSPYSPVSRLFRNALYLDVTAVPEFAHSAEARALVESTRIRSAIDVLREAYRLDYGAVMAVKRPVLEALYGVFREHVATGRGPRARAFADFKWRHGSALVDFATFHALADRFDSGDWRDWPDAFRDPRSAETAAFRAQNADAVGFHAFLQFEVDRQFASAARSASAAGMRIGLYGDLAIGSAESGSDRWSFPALFLDGVSVGAPPDDYASHGQNWSLPAIDPNRLNADRYRYWILLIRNAMDHCGALRIDHVMGLFRQFWIPEGRSGEDGAYVRFPWRALLAILAIESRRRRTIVIGEDLGTVPPGLPARLARYGILSTRVLYFERGPTGEFRPPSAYSRRALVTVNTHDHAPLAGWWAGREIELRYEVGDLSDAQRDSALEQRAAERASLRRRLAAARILPREASVDSPDLCAAVHAFLARSHAPLVGIALDDLAGETDPVNLPGVTMDRFPSWTRRMRLPLEALRDDAAVDRALQGIESRVRGIAG